MNRIESALPIVPQSQQVPYPHHPTGRCHDCRMWGYDEETHPNQRTCRIFREPRDAGWSCLIYVAVKP